MPVPSLFPMFMDPLRGSGGGGGTSGDILGYGIELSIENGLDISIPDSTIVAVVTPSSLDAIVTNSLTAVVDESPIIVTVE